MHICTYTDVLMYKHICIYVYKYTFCFMLFFPFSLETYYVAGLAAARIAFDSLLARF